MTNKIVMRTVEEFLADYKPVYVPILPIFISAISQAYAVEAGKVNFTRLEAVGDLRAKMLGPKDTEVHQVGAKESKKSFSKYFFGAQFIQSIFQDRRGYEDVVAQVLEENNKFADELLSLAEGTDEDTAKNAGLYWSKDANYVLKSSIQIAKATDGTHAADLYAQMIAAIETARQIDGQIVVFLYGDVISKFNQLFASTSRPLSAVLGEAAEGVNFIKLPANMVPASSHGFIVVNMDQVKLHYTTLPTVQNQGTNEEKNYAWTNFLVGSMMLEVLVSGAITRQPVTFAA